MYFILQRDVFLFFLSPNSPKSKIQIWLFFPKVLWFSFKTWTFLFIPFTINDKNVLVKLMVQVKSKCLHLKFIANFSNKYSKVSVFVPWPSRHHPLALFVLRTVEDDYRHLRTLDDLVRLRMGGDGTVTVTVQKHWLRRIISL